MSISANVVESRSSGRLRTSPIRLRVKTVDPAPMNAIRGTPPTLVGGELLRRPEHAHRLAVGPRQQRGAAGRADGARGDRV